MRIARIVILFAAISRVLGSAADAQLTSTRHLVLPVPHITESSDPCSGAAAAMVLRYWGARDAAPADFESTVACTDRGLPPEAFAAALRARGWKTEVSRHPKSSAKQLRAEIELGHPVVALLRDLPDANHYVVVVASTPDEVIVQDPSAEPYHVIRIRDFDRAWEASGRWMLVATPDAGAASPPAVAPAPVASETAVPAAGSVSACADLIAASMLRAKDRRPEAERGLRVATRLCPTDPVGWRELAELRFLDSRWRAAEEYAHRAVDLAPDDARSWNLLATSRYFSGDVRGALRSWSHVNQPAVSTVEVHGARNTNNAVVADTIGIRSGELLTSDRFIRAIRRLDQLPVSLDSRLKYGPLDDGKARVDIYLDEKDVVPAGPLPIATIGVGGLAFQALQFEVAGPTGHGEAFVTSWGWEKNWRHLSERFDMPAPGALPGVLSVTAFWERQVFAPSPDMRSTADRRHIGLGLANWATSWLWWRAGAALDRFDGRNYGAIQGGLEGRFIRDHVALNVGGTTWLASPTRPAFSAGTAWLSTRSTTRVDMPVWLTVFGTAVAGHDAPFQLWAGAGSSESSAAFLRAHALIRQGMVRGEVFGRRLEFGSVEYNRPIWQLPAGPVAVAGFVDAARASQRAGDLPATPLLIDIGIGLRLRPPAVGGVLRLDVARGIRDGHMRVSIGLLQKWPKR